MRMLTVLGLGLALVAVTPHAASAHEISVRGLILGVDRASGRIIVRFQPTAGGQSVTRSFALRPAPLKRLGPGESVAATVDEDAKPWAIRDVRVVGRQAIVAAPIVSSPVLRDVRPVEIGQHVPAGSFVDQDGKPFSFSGLRGTPYVMAFIYTRCRDARECPLVSAKFGLLQQRTTPNALHLVELTLDPAFDKPAVLRAYGRRFGADPARWTFLTGNPNKVLDFAAQFDVTAFSNREAGLIHSERTVIVDGDGVVRQLIDEVAWDPDEIIAQVRANERLASNPIARLNLWLSSAAVAMCGNSVAAFSGFEDLLIVLAIFGVSGWVLYRIGRAIHGSAA
jgi:protein SCO1/2